MSGPHAGRACGPERSWRSVLQPGGAQEPEHHGQDDEQQGGREQQPDGVEAAVLTGAQLGAGLVGADLVRAGLVGKRGRLAAVGVAALPSARVPVTASELAGRTRNLA